jgi:ketosteroid isomerase-like protein
VQRDIQNHPHFKVACRLWDGIAQAQPRVLREVLDEKGVWRMYGSSPLAGVYEGTDAVLSFLADVGERCDEMRADLIDVFVSEVGAVVRYSVWARRGSDVLETEHLLLTRIEDDKIVEAVFAPMDQGKYDRFWLE